MEMSHAILMEKMAISVYISTTTVRGHDQSQVRKVMLSKLSLEDDIESETELHEDRLFLYF